MATKSKVGAKAKAPARGKAAPARKAPVRAAAKAKAKAPAKPRKEMMSAGKTTVDIDHFLKTTGLDTEREKVIGQHIGYRYDVNLLPDYERLTPFLRRYMEVMGWDDLNWLEDVHLGYEEGRPAIFDRNINGWVSMPKGIKLPDNQQDRDMLARELLIKFQMSAKHPLAQLKQVYRKF
jgi:hypothetical protein